MQQYMHRARTPSPEPLQWHSRGFRNPGFQIACKNIEPQPSSEASTPRGQYSTADCDLQSTPRGQYSYAEYNQHGQYSNKAWDRDDSSDYEDSGGIQTPPRSNQPPFMYQPQPQQQNEVPAVQKTICLSDILATEPLPSQCSLTMEPMPPMPFSKRPERTVSDSTVEQPQVPSTPPMVPPAVATKKELRLATLFGDGAATQNVEKLIQSLQQNKSSKTQKKAAQPISLMQCFGQERADAQAQQRQFVTHMVSLGSVGHPLTCSEACKYVSKPRGCKDGASCDRCHLCKWNRYGPPKRAAGKQLS